jgi:hypothetical protein
MQPDPRTPIDLRFFLLFISAAYVTYLFHEFGHWSVGEVLGNRMVYSLNYVWPGDGHYVEQSHGLYVSVGGPAFSLLQASIALLIIERFGALLVYPFAFFPMFNRFFSVLLGGFGKQDEARVSAMLGTGPYLVAIIVFFNSSAHSHQMQLQAGHRAADEYVLCHHQHRVPAAGDWHLRTHEGVDPRLMGAAERGGGVGNPVFSISP